MANTIATAIGFDKSGRRKETHRLGSEKCSAQVATWKTFINTEIWADGRGRIEIIRDGEVAYSFTIGPEGETE